MLRKLDTVCKVNVEAKYANVFHGHHSVIFSKFVSLWWPGPTIEAKVIPMVLAPQTCRAKIV